MSFSLSFSPEFFFAEGEPYDRPNLALNADGKPISVYSAICSLPDTARAAIAKDVFDCDDWEMISAEDIVTKIQETDTCANLTVPVEVWIDPEGFHVVKVWS